MSAIMEHTSTKVSSPLVSIGMPVRNCQRTLAPAIRSILHQTYSNWELLIADDGSTDATLSVARTFDDERIRIFTDGKHKRISVRLNETILKSTGTFFARMDGDDISYPDRIATQVTYLCDHPHVDVVGASMLVFNSDFQPRGKRTTPECHDDICSDPIKGIGLSHPTILGKVSWFRQHMYVDEMSLIEDQDLFLRSYSSSRFANVPMILLGYREENINLLRNSIGRAMLLKRLTSEYVHRGEWAKAMQATMVQSAKGAVYIVMGVVGLKSWLLNYRAGDALTFEELQEWQRTKETLGLS